ncbi:MAG TPA: alpha/beta hydrolase [Acetobacteraceae bacterium]|nr:alpha/beta hydrolase [Acetobacteraceae bacterium]
MPALHADAARLVEMIRAAGRPPFEAMTPTQARAAYAASRPVLQLPRQDVAEIRDLTIPGPAGALPLRLYRGQGTAADAALPCLLFLHGGGWVIGDLESHDGLCRALANAASCRVVAVDYRLAPEHPFPAAVEDAAAALAAIFAHAPEWRIDPARVAVGGDSAGGNLAAVLALMGRDGLLPRPVFQLLIYPVTDLTMASDSYARITDGVPLTARTMRWFVEHYTPHPAQRLDWRASPLRAESVAGTPPALVVTVAHDPLCDEGRAYADRLEREGVPVAALHIGDQAHGLLTMSAILRPAALVLDFIGATLRAVLHPL